MSVLTPELFPELIRYECCRDYSKEEERVLCLAFLRLGIDNIRSLPKSIARDILAEIGHDLLLRHVIPDFTEDEIAELQAKRMTASLGGTIRIKEGSVMLCNTHLTHMTI